MPERMRQVAPEVVHCIAEGRAPSEAELFRVADQIWTDLRGTAPAFRWGDPHVGDAERRLILRMARTALSGAD